jgi:preprotein translocase subunit SecG
VVVVVTDGGSGGCGSSQTIFGSRGAATFLSKVTTICAIGFMITSLSLVYLNAQESSRSLFDKKTGEKKTPDVNAAAGAAASPTPTASATVVPSASVTPVTPTVVPPVKAPVPTKKK